MFHPPEVGGILGGHDNIIDTTFYDIGLSGCTKCSYIPNTPLINSVIYKWQLESIAFMGIYHTHFYNVTSLSPGDEQYAKAILSSMPKSIAYLFFPILVIPQRELVCYIAKRDNESVFIRPDELKII